MRKLVLLFVLFQLLYRLAFADIAASGTAPNEYPSVPPRPDYIPKELPPCPTWDPRTLISPYYPCPGQQLGLPKHEAELALAPEVKKFLDVVLELYKSPSIFADEDATLRAFGLEVTRREWSTLRTLAGYTLKPFRDYLIGGILGRPGWEGLYQCCEYNFRDDPVNYQWFNKLNFKINYKQECVSSRAVEGYLDLYLYPAPGGVHPRPPENWYRHGEAGGAYAVDKVKGGPRIDLGFIAGCLVRLEITGKYFRKENSNDDLHN